MCMKRNFRITTAGTVIEVSIPDTFAFFKAHTK